MSDPRLPIRDKRDRLRQLRAFCETVRRGSVSRAAEHLGVTQPAVSLQVRDLEHELGATLFARGATGISPTPAGERLHRMVEPLVRKADSLFEDVHRHLDLEPDGGVRLALSNAGATFVLPPRLKRFRDAYPLVPVRMETTPVYNAIRRLLDDEVDLALGPKEPFDEATLVYHELLTYELVLVAPLDHPLAGRASVTPQDAAAWPAVVPPPESYSRQFGESAARALGLDINAVAEVGGWGALKRYVEAGFGVSVIPSLVVSDTDRLAVVAVELDEPPRSFGVYLRGDRHFTPEARRFLEMLLSDAPELAPPTRSATRRGPR